MPNRVKVAVTRLSAPDADLLFAALRAMATNPLDGDVYKIGEDSYYRVVDAYLVFFDLVPADHVVNVTTIERPH